MSLSKQLLILISALFLLIFGVNLALSINNTKAYLENESQSHAQDTATSLGLSLSPYMKDLGDPTIKAMISAIFDMGYYGEIRLVDANGKEVLSLTNDKRAEGVPAWFIDFLPISPSVANSEISSGWTLSGVVYVTVNPAYAYSALYRQTKTSFFYSLTALAISMLVLTLALRITLASLKRIEQLARKIADSHFDTIERLPLTTEVKNVAISMNMMSQKLKSVINGLNIKLETTGALLLRDELTGLFKRSVFETDLKHLIMEQNAAYLCLIKVDSLPELVKEHGSGAIDALLQEFATLIQDQIQLHSKITIKAYRFFGGEFALLAKTDDLTQIETLCRSLSAGTAELGRHHIKSDLIHIGVSSLNPLDTLETAVAAAQEAYEQARLIDSNGYYICTDRHPYRDISDWKTLVFECIDKANYSLALTGKTYDFDNNHIIMEEVFTQAYDRQGTSVPIAPFISIAEKYAKIVDLDKGVIQRALNLISTTGIQHALAINLSTRTIKNAEFVTWLGALLKINPAAAKQLVFSFSAYAVTKDIDAYINFFYTLHQWGGRGMIKRFDPHSMPTGINKKLKPDFVRLAREIGNGISASQKKQEFVQTMQEMAKLLDIALLAENIQENEDCKTLKQIGIKGASRK